MSIADWFLDAGQRGNPDTRIDDRRDGIAWTEGNAVEVLVDGADYFAALHAALSATERGDTVLFTGLEGNADTRLVGREGSEVGIVLAEAARRGVAVRGLVWRAHALIYHEVENLVFSRQVNGAGGEVLLDQRVSHRGSHHQKVVVVRNGRDPAQDVAFVGGIDIAHGRRDTARHSGDVQPADLSEDNYGPRPPWHDCQVRVRGPAVDDIAYTFRERWDDPSPVDNRTPLRAALHLAARQPREPSALPPERNAAAVAGPCAVQVLRTYPARRKGYPFARDGERSIARAYIKAFRRAARLVYLEDQYLWSYRAAEELCRALSRESELRLVIVIPRYPDPDGRLLGAASAIGRDVVQRALYEAGGERVAVYDLENEQGTPVYVHSKTCVIDDVWMAVGSDNLNRRSWTHDSEISCAVLDSRQDPREPRFLDDGGDGARVLPRETRLRLSCEHAAIEPGLADSIVEPKAWFDMLRLRAEALDAWHAAGRAGPRPPGHLRAHPREETGASERRLLHWVHAGLLDPDGRPRKLKARDGF